MLVDPPPGLPFILGPTHVQWRNPGWAPEVLAAAVRVQLRMNPVRRLLYALRPSTLLTLLAGALALAWLVGGSAAALALLTALLYTAVGRSGAKGRDGGEGAAQEDGTSLAGVGSDLDEVSSVSGISDAGSDLLHTSSDGEAPPLAPLPFEGAGGAAPSGGWGPGNPASSGSKFGRRGEAPEGDDTPPYYEVGSEEGLASQAQRSARLRRRGSGSAFVSYL